MNRVFHIIVIFLAKEMSRFCSGQDCYLSPVPFYMRKPRPAELSSLSKKTIREGVESGSVTGLTHSEVCVLTTPCWFAPPMQRDKVFSRQDPWVLLSVSPNVPLMLVAGSGASCERTEKGPWGWLGWRRGRKALRVWEREIGPPGCGGLKVRPPPRVGLIYRPSGHGSFFILRVKSTL